MLEVVEVLVVLPAKGTQIVTVICDMHKVQV